MANGNGYVTWRALITIAISVIASLLSLVFVFFQIHSAHPHEDSAQFRDVQRIEKKIERLEEKIDRLEESVSRAMGKGVFE